MSLPARRLTPEILSRLRRLGPHDVAPDGRCLVVLVEELGEGGKRFDANLYRLDLHSPDAGLIPLTRSSRRKALPRFAPDGRLGFLSQPDPEHRRGEDGAPPRPEAGRDGDDAPMQVHRMRIDGGEPEPLTDLPGGVSSFRFSADGGKLVLLAPVDPDARDLDHDRELWQRQRDRPTTGRTYSGLPVRHWDHFTGPRHAHLIVADADGRGARDLMPGQGQGHDDADWDVSPDGRFACIDRCETGANQRSRRHLDLIDLESGARRRLTEGDSEHWAPAFSPDGRRLACLAHPEQARVTGKRDVKLLDLESGRAELITAGLDLWPGPPLWVGNDRIAFGADRRGHHLLHLLDLASGTVSELTADGHAAEPRLGQGGRRLFFLRDRVHAPADLHAVDVGSREIQRLSHANADLLEDLALPAAASFEVEGAEGAPVQAFEVRPPDYNPARRHSLLLWIHGGPLSSYLDEFHLRWNAPLFAAAGHLVVMVNPRGSTGFGQRFIEDNNGNWGDHCYRDLLAVADACAARADVDPARMAVMGASYGGYMTNWILGHEERFACAVSHAGLFNLTAFHGTTDHGPDWELEFGGRPWLQPELYEKWSPHRHAARFKTPTLVTHGELDYRVPVGEGLQLFQALKEQGVPAKFLYFPDENHWILKPGNHRLWNETVLAWLAEHLGESGGESGGVEKSR